MTIDQDAAGEPVFDDGATAEPLVEIIETPDAEQEETPPPRVFTQEELDAAISRRIAKERRKIEREMASRQAVTPPPALNLDPNAYTNTQDYIEALATDRARQIQAQQAQEQQRQAQMAEYLEREETARDVYDDFDAVAYNPNLAVTDTMAEAIRASDVGPQVLYYLGSRPEQAAQIARLSPVMQAKQIGVIEAELAKGTSAPLTSSAPKPINPVAPRAAKKPSVSTADPKATSAMTTSEWIAAERQRQIEKLKAGR